MASAGLGESEDLQGETAKVSAQLNYSDLDSRSAGQHTVSITKRKTIERAQLHGTAGTVLR